MFRKRGHGPYRTIILHIFQKFFEIGIPTGITFHACFCDIFQQEPRLIFAHMKNTVTTVIGLFFVLRCKKNGIDKFDHIWTDKVIEMGRYYGYNRVSTKEQHLDRGRKSIENFCKERGYYLSKIFEDKQTGKNFERPRYIVLKEDVVQAGDTIIIPEYDRLGRADETKQELEYFKEHNIRIIFLDIPTTQTDLSVLNDEMSIAVLRCINDMLISFYDLMAKTELQRKRKRQKEGIEAKKARGEWGDYGRPRKMSKEDFAQHYIRVVKKEIGSLALMRELGLQQDTYFRYVREYKKDHIDEMINNNLG